MRTRNQVITKNSFATGKFYRIDVGFKSYFHKSKARLTNKEVFAKLDCLNVNYKNDEDTTTPDLMGVATLKLSQYTTYPTKVVLSNTNNTIQMEITLSWY